MFSVNYMPKMLHIAIRNLEGKVCDKLDIEKDDNGIIYAPDQVFNKVNTRSEDIYNEFFKKGYDHTIVTIETEQGPGELIRYLKEDYNADNCISVGGIIAPFGIELKDAKRLIEDLTKDPKKYFKSPEKEYFTPKEKPNQNQIE